MFPHFESPLELLLDYLPRLLVLFACLPVHEFGHAFVADKLGDPTPRRDGRLTLNPFAHLDLFGSLCLLLGGFGWAKPVIVNPFNLRDRKGNMALVALAGPVTNLLMCFLFAGLAKVAAMFLTASWGLYVFFILYMIARINLSLAIFNLIPVPPLDGSKILYFFLPNRAAYWMQEHEQIFSIAFLVLLVLGNTAIMPYGIGDLLGLIIDPIWNGIKTLFGLPI